MGTPKIDGPDAVVRFLELEHAGVSTPRMASEFGMSVRAVSRWRHRLGVSRAEPPVTRSAADREFARRLLDDGCSLEETARTIGVRATTIRKWFPDVPGWDKHQAGVYGQEVRRMNRIERGM